MTSLTARRASFVVLALVLSAAGCSSEGSTVTDAASSAVASAAQSASAQLCDGFADLKTSAADLASTKVDASGTPEQVQQQVEELSAKADKVHDDLATMMRESQGGPAAAVIGVLNQKTDALRAELATAKADAQADAGPKITAAQEAVTTALEPVTTAVGTLCPAG